MTWLFDILRSMVFWLDQLIYGFIPPVYDFIMYLARMDIFKDNRINEFASNIYAIIGVFMIFKMAFSLLSAIINPDMLTDEKKGFGKIIQRSVIALTLVILIPKGFEYSVRLQDLILSNHIIEKMIIGENGGAGAGDTIAGYSLKTFITCASCTPDEKTEWDANFNSMSQLPNIADHLNDKVDGNPDEYKYNYVPVLSTFTGGFILYLLIIFCFDIARRAVKLGFLELLTPVAVVSFATQTSGETIFSRWLKAFGSTYMALFIRIVAIVFIAYLTSLLADLDINQPGSTVPELTKGLANLFILFGILVFGKQAPQFISELFGIKPDFELDIRKVLGNVPIFGGAMVAGGALAAGAMTGGLAKLGAGLGSGISGAIHSSPGNRGANFLNSFKQGQSQVSLRGKPGQQFGAMVGASKKTNADLVKAQNAAAAKDRFIRKGNKLKGKTESSIYAPEFMAIKNGKKTAKDNNIAAQNTLAAAQANLGNNPNDIAARTAYADAAAAQSKTQRIYDAYSKDMEEYLADPANSKTAERYNAVEYVNNRTDVKTRRETRKADRDARRNKGGSGTTGGTTSGGSSNNTTSSQTSSGNSGQTGNNSHVDDNYDPGDWNS